MGRGEPMKRSVVVPVLIVILAAVILSYGQSDVTYQTGGAIGLPAEDEDEITLPGPGGGTWDSGDDCTNGGSTGSGSGSTKGCRDAFNAACTKAKQKAENMHKTTCQNDCNAKPGYHFKEFKCKCPLTGNNPNTGQPYTCFTKNGATCTASTIAQCDCICEKDN